MSNWIKDTAGVIESAVNIGLIKHQDELFLVDTGIDNSAVNKARKKVDMNISGALVTHHHADHMGGCSKLEKLGVTELYGPDQELAMIHDTLLEPATMFGGAYPPEDLRNRHLEARPAISVKSLAEQDIVKPISTPGHTLDHQCFLYNDVLFSGDSTFTAETIDKYKILFAVNPKQAAGSLDILLETDFDVMIPGHGPLQENRSDAEDVILATREHYNSTYEKVLSAIGEKLEFGNYMQTMLDHFQLNEIVKDRGFLQYILYQVPLMGYLSNLLDDKAIQIDTTSSGPQIIAL